MLVEFNLLERQLFESGLPYNHDEVELNLIWQLESYNELVDTASADNIDVHEYCESLSEVDKIPFGYRETLDKYYGTDSIKFPE